MKHQILQHLVFVTSVSLPRDRFWDIHVSKIDSPTRQPLLPRPSCVRAASPHLRKLGAGYAALPQMTGRDFSYAYFVSPLRYRTPDKQCGPGRYRGLTAFASLSMAVSGCQFQFFTIDKDILGHRVQLDIAVLQHRMGAAPGTSDQGIQPGHQLFEMKWLDQI
ncbi:hypothetical protein, partial [Thiolapillus sp.]|uniref:hypothetical protein n=1 Tax=Thiolapillus sp. TaxID=2017437 RepID=UPI003AF969DD